MSTESGSTKPAHPIVSDGTTVRLFSVSAIRRGKTITVVWGDDMICTPYGRITGTRRKLTIAYLVKRDGNRCSLQFRQWCIMGERPFENPEKAEIDHIEICEPPDQHLRNLRLACGPCNKHAQSLQWKSNRAAASAHREREMQGRTVQPEREVTSHAEFVSIHAFPGAVKLLFGKDGYLEKPGQHRPKKWLIGILPEKVGTGRSTTYGKYVNDEFMPQGYLTEEAFDTGSGKEVHLVRTTKDASKLLERELGKA